MSRTENDYQVDVATDAGRREYERIIDRCSELGITHLLYTARDSRVSGAVCVDNLTYAPDCELDLWFTLGEKLRTGEWVPGDDPVPRNVKVMLDYAKKMGVKLVAYAIPIAAWLAEKQPTPPWIREVDTHYYRTTLADPSFQDWFVDACLRQCDRCRWVQLRFQLFRRHKQQHVCAVGGLAKHPPTPALDEPRDPGPQ